MRALVLSVLVACTVSTSLSRAALADDEMVQIEAPTAAPQSTTAASQNGPPQPNAGLEGKVGADGSEPDSADSANQATDEAKALRRARKKRTAGIILTGVGAAGVVGGSIYLAYGSATGAFRGEFGGIGALLGLVPLAVGAAAVAVGIPLWVSGQSTLSRVQKVSESWLFPRVAVTPSGGAVSFGGAF